MKVWKMFFLFTWVILRFHVSFPGCIPWVLGPTPKGKDCLPTIFQGLYFRREWKSFQRVTIWGFAKDFLRMALNIWISPGCYMHIYIYTFFLHIYKSYITYLVRAQRSTCCLFSFARHLVGKMVIHWNAHHDQHSLGVFIYIITPNIITEVYVHVIIM